MLRVNAVEEKTQCPRCMEACHVDARVCPHCRFPLWEYKENRRLAELCEIHRVPLPDEHFLQELENKYLKQSLRDKRRMQKDAAGGLVLFGILFMFIPLVGPLLGGITVLFALILWLGSHGPIDWVILKASGEYEKELARARMAVREEYRVYTVNCPACRKSLKGHLDKLYERSGANAYVECDKCGAKLFRFNDNLLYIPYPDTTVTGSVRDYLADAGCPEA